MRLESYATWLETIKWNKFATFTTPYEMSLRSARRIMERYHGKLKIEGQESWMFWVAEKFKLKDGYHMHALLKVDFPWDNELLWMLWQDVSVYKGQSSKYNRCDIQNRNFKKKAGSYLCKYLLKNTSDFDILT